MSPAGTTSAAPPSPTVGAQWEALGTGVVLRTTDPSALDSARRVIEDQLDLVDRACSRFRADSELVRLNERAGRRTEVGALLFEALEVALRAAELSDGDVDPTIGRALELAGYDRDWSLLEPAGAGGERQPAPTITVRPRSGWTTVELDARRRSVRVPRGIRLDLGASGKAWAADRGAAAAAAAVDCGVLLSLGGDIATCGQPPAGGWRIHVTDDHRSPCSAPGQTIVIESGGLATSSSAVRRWRHQGRLMHHIIDPRTSQPARTHWRTVSVAAADCTDANTGATAALIRCERAPAWLERVGLPARLVDWEGNVRSLAGWPT